jgi:hypothetical protein
MSGERIQSQTLVDDLTLDQFQAIPRAQDQELVTALGQRCLQAWQQNREVNSIFDFSIADDMMLKRKIACVDMRVLRNVFEPSGYDPEGAVHVGDVDYIFIPQYPREYLEEQRDRYQEFVESARLRYHFNDVWLTYSADQAMGVTNRIILLDKNYVIKSLKERDFSSAVEALDRLLKEDRQRSYYLTAIAEELAHAVVDPFTRGAEQEVDHSFLPDFPKVLSEGMANGLSLRALTLDELERLYLVTDHKFLLLSSLFFQEMIDSGLLVGMQEPSWDPSILPEIRKIMIRIYGKDSFVPKEVFSYRYPPTGYGPADWLKGLKE